MKMRWGLCLAVILLVAAYFYWTYQDGELFGRKKKDHNNITAMDTKQITEVPYNKDGIEANYPSIIEGGKEEQLTKWNQLISSDFEKILHIYSFNPFPELTPYPAASVPVILKIGYEIKENTKKFISIFYTAAYNSPYVAHPTDLVYTTNIDKVDNKRLRLPDYIKINEDFIKDFRTWDIITYEEAKPEIIKAIRDYIANMSDEDLLLGFQAADQIGSANHYDIYSYLTPDKLGISIGVPNYLGDHAEFEREYTKLKDYLKMDLQQK